MKSEDFFAAGYNGRLIVVEGCDGSGKSTQLYLLKCWLEYQNYPVFFTEWNSSKLVRSYTKKAKKENMLTPTTFSLMHSSDFADRYEKMILPHLRAGYIVLADRYTYTAFARDVARECDYEWVRNVYSFAMRPHLTFYFKVPIDVALERITAARNMIKYHEAGMDLELSNDPVESFRLFQGRVKKEYDRMSSKEDFVVMDGTESIEEQQQIMRRIVTNKVLLNFNSNIYEEFLSKVKEISG
ncbi:MAG: dTMP kinase [Clostridiales bacterium]|nr:dTMP kinase [Clostridiales bacterium]MCF8023133.1 dTMP kinase [Clostridiales bacterium]